VGRALLENTNVCLAYLFGSQARGSGGSLSDMDVAVLLRVSSFEEALRVQREVAKALMLPEDRVDVVDLSKAPVSLRHTVLKEGVKVLDRGGFEESVASEVHALYPETRFLATDGLRGLAGSGDSMNLNIDLVNRRVTVLRGEVAYLREVLARPIDEVVGDEHLRRAFERAVEVSIEAMLDVCRHVVAALGLGLAETYADYVNMLVEREKVPKDLGENLLRLVRWRNMLVNRYVEVDYRELHREALMLLEEAAPRFIGWATEITAR